MYIYVLGILEKIFCFGIYLYLFIYICMILLFGMFINLIVMNLLFSCKKKGIIAELWFKRFEINSSL